jgi:hypothetical protein
MSCTRVVAGTLGRVGLVVPLALVALGIPAVSVTRGRRGPRPHGVGLAALLLATTGLVHIARGLPDPSDNATAMREAGGILGFLVSSPLVAAVTTWVARPASPADARVRAACGQRDARPRDPGPGPRAARLVPAPPGR